MVTRADIYYVDNNAVEYRTSEACLHGRQSLGIEDLTAKEYYFRFILCTT